MPSYFINSTIASSLIFLLAVWAMFIYAIYKQNSLKIARVKCALIATVGLFGWFFLVYAFGKISFFSKIPLFAPNLLLGFLFLFIVLKSIYRSKIVRVIVDTIPMHWMIGVQTYRIVGYGFFVLYSMNLLPAVFVFTAGIGDIIVGLSAPIVAVSYFLKKHFAKRLAIIWNIVGIIDLVLAISIGILAYPRPVQILPILPTEISTDVMSLYPMVLVPLFAVPLALLLHLFSLRKVRLLKKGGEMI